MWIKDIKAFITVNSLHMLLFKTFPNPSTHVTTLWDNLASATTTILFKNKGHFKKGHKEIYNIEQVFRPMKETALFSSIPCTCQRLYKLQIIWYWIKWPLKSLLILRFYERTDKHISLNSPSYTNLCFLLAIVLNG